MGLLVATAARSFFIRDESTNCGAERMKQQEKTKSAARKHLFILVKSTHIHTDTDTDTDTDTRIHTQIHTHTQFDTCSLRHKGSDRLWMVRFHLWQLVHLDACKQRVRLDLQPAPAHGTRHSIKRHGFVSTDHNSSTCSPPPPPHGIQLFLQVPHSRQPHLKARWDALLGMVEDVCQRLCHHGVASRGDELHAGLCFGSLGHMARKYDK